MKYRGKNGVIMWSTFVFVTAMFGGLCAIVDYSKPGEYIPMIILSVAVIGFVAWFLIRNFYVLTETELKVCLGPTTSKLYVNSVVSLKKVISFIASGAGSAKRIEIIYMNSGRKEKTYISPKNEDEFIGKLCEYNPDITVLEAER